MTTKHKNQLIKIVRGKLETNEKWAIRAMVKIYECNQTVEEQCSDQTVDDNGIGFNGIDASILSSFAKQVQSGRNMSQKQMAIIMKKMKKYARQVIDFIPENKQLEMLEQE
jgi:hypothetical protein